MNAYEPFAFGKALAHSKLTTKAKITGHSLAVYADGKTGYCYPTQEQLAEASSQSLPSVTRGLNELVSAGFLRVAKNERKRFNRNNVYWLRIPGAASLEDKQPDIEQASPPAAEPVAPASVAPQPLAPAAGAAQPSPPAPVAVGGFPQQPAWLRQAE